MSVVVLRRGSKRHEILISQLNVNNLRRLFKVNPDEVFLSDDIEGTAFFPSENGSFELHDIDNIVSLDVEGPDLAGASSSRSVSLTSTPVSGTPGPSLPSFRSVVASKSQKSQTFNLKITKASVEFDRKGKATFFPDCQFILEMSEETANLQCIISKINRKWEGQFVILGNDGIKLDESDEIGLSFWKSPRRKFFAVELKEYRGLGKGKKKKREISDDEDDSSDYESCEKKTRLSSKVDTILYEVEDVKKSIDSIFNITKNFQIPVGFRKAVKETFKCSICLTVPIKPPMLVTKCCNNVLGCENCVKRWYAGNETMTKSCPICNKPRGYSETMVLKGVDDFLKALSKIDSFDNAVADEESE